MSENSGRGSLVMNQKHNRLVTGILTRDCDSDFRLLIGYKERSRTPGLQLMGFMTLLTFYYPSLLQ